MLQATIGSAQYQHIQNKLALSEVELQQISIKGQPSLLLAPTIAGFWGAIPIPALANFVEQKLRLQVLPTVEQTHQLIQRSDLFNLTGLVAFDLDNIAAQTIAWLQPYLSGKAFASLFRLVTRREHSTGHLTPLGFVSLNDRLCQTANQFLTDLQNRSQSVPPSALQDAADTALETASQKVLQVQ